MYPMPTKKTRLAIYTCGTEGYTYAMTAQARRIQSCVAACDRDLKLLIIVVGDGSEGNLKAVKEYEKLLPDAKVELLHHNGLQAGDKNYDNATQLLIAQLRTMATSRAVAWGAEYCLSMDSDVLPPSNALRCMIDMLEFDNGYYGVAACPYPSQGGGSFLCGRGTPQRPILPCFYEDEKDVPARLLNKVTKLRDRCDKYSQKHKRPREDLIEKLRAAEKEIDKIQPKENVFALNAKKWRQRGWFDNAYPAIGLGAVVPSDWCGFGCTMMNKEALALCDWSGYDGSGTEDLFVVWSGWQPRGIKIAAIPHCPCDHVIRHREEKNKYIHITTGHEIEGECVGHLRQLPRPWYSHDTGERYNQENDGQVFTTPT
jgi:hypothetical protein